MFIDFIATAEDIRITFRFEGWFGALIEMNINRANAGDQSDKQSDRALQEIQRILDNNRYSRSLCESCLECKWYQVMTLIRRCSAQMQLAADTRAVTVTLKDRNGTITNIAAMDGNKNAAAHLASFFGSHALGHGERSTRAVAGISANQPKRLAECGHLVEADRFIAGRTELGAHP